MGRDRLYDREEQVILLAEEVLASDDLPAVPRERYRQMLQDYRKLLGQLKRMVKISDMVQKEMNRLNERLEELSTRDGLTGIYNRRHFDKLYTLEWRRATRSGQPLSVLMLDIDHFKLFNDHYGHGAGDDCLRRVAACLADTLRRSTESVARCGGEEFAGILSDTDAAGALKAAERVLANVRALGIPHAASPIGDWLTASLGLATMPKVTPGAPPAALLEAADRLLYEAKRAGRNRLASAILD